MNKFKEELNTIKNDCIREQTKLVLDKVHPDFFTAAASSTGKYHPKYALGEGGLYRHTKAAVAILNDILNLAMCDNFHEDMKDYMRAAVILHDCCKSGKDWDSRYTVHEHPVLASDFVHEVLGECEFSEMVGHLIASHMGQWNTNFRSRVVLPVPSTDAERMVHLADYLASRKHLEFVFEEEE